MRSLQLEKEFMNTDKSGVTVYSDLITRFKKGLGNLSNSLNLLQGAKTIVFYIDEGHELSEGVTISLLQTAFSALQEKGCSTPHAVVLGSTTSKVAIAAPPRAARGQTSSARFRDTSSDPFVLPWCALPVNLHLQPSDLSSLPEPPEGTKQVSKQYQRPSLRPLPPAKELRGIKTQLKIGRPL